MINLAEVENLLFFPEDRMNVVSMACQSPEIYGYVGETHWSISLLQSTLIREKIFEKISWTTVQRILASIDLKPHKMKYYLNCKDTDLLKKARKICRLYLNPPKNAILLSFDEKSGTQALERKILRQTGPAKPFRMEFEYKRHGTTDLFAAFEVKTGKVFGKCYKKHSSKEFLHFLKLLRKKYKRKRLIIILDNLKTHYTKEIRLWLKSQKGMIKFVFTPKHASWLNQVEIWFRHISQKCLKRLSVLSIEELKKKIMLWIRTYNRYYAKPYNWKFNGILKGV